MVWQPHAVEFPPESSGDRISFRLVHVRGTEEDDWKVSVGAVHALLPHQARRLAQDEDSPEVADEYLGFRLAFDKEVK